MHSQDYHRKPDGNGILDGMLEIGRKQKAQVA
jgi:hypothetical protein